jgi:hypothetical protein
MAYQNSNPRTKSYEAFGLQIHGKVIPEKYIDFLLLSTFRAPFAGLENGNLPQGIEAFRVGVDMLETVVRARNEMVPDAELNVELDKLVFESDATEAKKAFYRSRKKLEMILARVIEGTPHEEDFEVFASRLDAQKPDDDGMQNF